VFLAAQPDGSPLIRITRAPDRKAIAEHIRATGEELAGVELVPVEVRFTVKVDGDADGGAGAGGEVE